MTVLRHEIYAENNILHNVSLKNVSINIPPQTVASFFRLVPLSALMCRTESRVGKNSQNIVHSVVGLLNIYGDCG